MKPLRDRLEAAQRGEPLELMRSEWEAIPRAVIEPGGWHLSGVIGHLGVPVTVVDDELEADAERYLYDPTYHAFVRVVFDLFERAVRPLGRATPGIDEATTADVIERAWKTDRELRLRRARGEQVDAPTFYVSHEERRAMLRTLPVTPVSPLGYAGETIFGMRLVAR